MIASHHFDGALIIAPKSEGRYINQYRFDHPDERFDVMSYEDIVDSLSYRCDEKEAIDYLIKSGFKCDKAEAYLPLLRRMVHPCYKAAELKELLPLRDELVERGYFQIQRDPAEIFCNRNLIIRGYYSGTPIAEALQDLPNISLSWDLGRPVLGSSPIEGQAMSSWAEVKAFVLAEKEQGRGPDDLYVYANFGLPESLGIPLLDGPYAPNEGRVIVLEASPKRLLDEEDLLPAEALAEIHVPTRAVARKRAEEDYKFFLRHPNVIARLYVSGLD